MKIRCIEHMDEFGPNERTFWLEVEDIPKELIEEAKAIDGENFDMSCFGICVIQTGNDWFVCMDEPRRELFYIDNDGDKHWLQYETSKEEEHDAIEYCMNSLKENGQKKKYDVWFMPECSACVVVEANSYQEAREKAEEILCNMESEELMRRIADAVDFMGVRIDYIDEIEEE